MDPAAHFFTGAFLARAISRERRERTLFWTLSVAAMIPDIDVLASPWGDKVYWLYHRGFTHSFVGSILLAIPFALFLWKKKIRSFRISLCFSIAAVWLHVLSDWGTSFGSPIGMPFCSHNFSLDIISNFNWVFWIAAMVVLRYLRRHGQRAWPVLSGCLLLLLGYQFFGRVMTKRIMQDEPACAIIPHLGKPYAWRAHVTDSSAKEYRLYHVWPFLNKRKFILSAPMAVQSPAINAAREDPQVHLFFKHNRWPVAEEEKTAEGWLVRFSNLLYYWRGRWGERIEVCLSEDLKIINSKKVYQTW